MMEPLTKEQIKAAYAAWMDVRTRLDDSSQAVIEAIAPHVQFDRTQPQQAAPSPAPKRSLSSVLEEMCPGVRKRNWPVWDGPYREEQGGVHYPELKMTQDEDDDIDTANVHPPSPAPEGIADLLGCIPTADDLIQQAFLRGEASGIEKALGAVRTTYREWADHDPDGFVSEVRKRLAPPAAQVDPVKVEHCSDISIVWCNGRSVATFSYFTDAEQRKDAAEKWATKFRAELEAKRGK